MNDTPGNIPPVIWQRNKQQELRWKNEVAHRIQAYEEGEMETVTEEEFFAKMANP